MRGKNDTAKLFFTEGTVVAEELETIESDASSTKKRKDLQPKNIGKFWFQPKYGCKLLLSVPKSFPLLVGQKVGIVDFQFKQYEKHQIAVFNHTDNGCFFFGTVHERVIKTKTVKQSYLSVFAALAVCFVTSVCCFFGLPYPIHIDEGYGIKYWSIIPITISWAWAVLLPFFTLVVLNIFTFSKKKKVDLAIRNYVISSIENKYKKPVEYQTYFESNLL